VTQETHGCERSLKELEVWQLWEIPGEQENLFRLQLPDRPGVLASLWLKKRYFVPSECTIASMHHIYPSQKPENILFSPKFLGQSGSA
jgi:hypothetical protein